MKKEYRQDRKVRPTSSRSEAAANRHLQLVGSTFDPKKGKTLTEKMGDELDKALEERGKKMQEHAGEEELSDDEENDYLDWMLQSEGFVKGCLRMLAIMRSTTPKKELERARIRIQYGKES